MKKQAKKQFNYYQLVSKSKKLIYGAFPPSKEGREMAQSWADKVFLETGEKLVVKKR
jgi:hypothetical protein